MIENLDEIIKWVEDNAKAEPGALRLKFHGRKAGDFDLEAAVRQVECRQRFGKKLAQTLAANPRLFFPTTLSGEQCTSDALAEVHASLLPEGARLVDLTAGLGIDAGRALQRGIAVTAVERSPEVAEALKVNFPEIEVVNADCREFVKDYSGEPFDVAFIDPARRAADGGRVYGIADCEPDVVAMLPDIRNIAKRLIIKLSPMLDVAATVAAFPGAETVMALGTATECKELVVELPLQAPAESVKIIARTIGTPDFSFTPEQKASATASYLTPTEGMTLYEPFPSVMKAGAYALLCERYGVGEIAPNTHVFLSETPVADFPGQGREVIEVVPFNSKYIKRLASRYPRLDVAVRNFPFTADALAKKLRVRPGGDLRLIAVTTSTSAPLMIVTRPHYN